ncbi:hypothetical protein [Methylobacterium sp. UNC300MFChir4.1]|uniref:hypothetical protein n=1 Tax=Methylobacterium sp. UNC300MFChir4.1 TaxID=1502747 RepID=UPI0011144620|nr:hypothetical protein [Methylobacterium sp. UNC300MFChir4.1]
MTRHFAAALAIVIAGAPVSALSQNLNLPAVEAGTRITAASTRIGEHIDWGAGSCGEPVHLPGTCVWKLERGLSLTAHAYGSQTAATIIITRWMPVDLKDVSARVKFDQACRGLVAALLPSWQASQISAFASALIGSADKDRLANVEATGFALYIYPGSITCEAQRAND